MNDSKLSGILPAVVTPVDAEFRFSEGAFERLLAHVYAAGVDGVYVCGQTGEGLQQRADQRKCVVEAAIRHAPRGRHVIVHVGAESTATAVELARHAESCGATAISSLPPLGAYSFAEIVAYYRTVAGATRLPFLVYYFPAASPAIGSLEQVERLCELPNVAGLKFTDMDLYKLSRLKLAGRVVFNGYDEILAAGLLMGADGGIGSFYNVAPQWFVDLFAAARSGNWERARERQEMINELITAGLKYPVHSAVKAMLAWMGIDCGPCIPPRRPLTEGESVELIAWLEGSQLARQASSRL